MLSLAITLHILAATLWVGGMFFAHMALRPVAVALLEPPLRLPLMNRVLGRFFFWVWLSILTLAFTGYWIVFNTTGSILQLPLHLQLMQIIGWIMFGLFIYLYFVPYRQMCAALDGDDLPSAAKALNAIRQIVVTNLILGIGVIVVAASRLAL